jgi:biotin operon repressor
MDYDKKSKEELIEEIENQSQIILDLQIKLQNSKSSDGRKSQVLELLRTNGNLSILDISEKLKISTKNVSSQLTYLRTDGYKIFTDEKGRKVLFETEKIEEIKEIE